MLDTAQAWSVSGARRSIAETFRSNDLDSPELDARILVGHVLQFDHAQMIAAADRMLSGREIAAINALVARRLRHEPVARILGRKEFWSLPLRVSGATLVPRPETETVVDAALATVSGRKQSLRIADLGTGTGAILLALLHELPNATGIGTDIDPLALAVAQDNARELGLQDRCEFIQSDFCTALTGRFDLLVSNPPYIARAELSALPPEVRDYDPRLALDGGADGLDCYRSLAAKVGRLLKSGGAIVVEIGAGQSDEVTAIFEAAALQAAAPPRPDLAGIPRALVFRRLS